jgi:thioredoxin 1
MLVKLTDQNFKKEINKSSKLVLVEIGAQWSGACSIMEPILNQLALEYNEQIMVGRIDIETNKIVSREFEIDKLPIYLFFRNGQLVDHIIGSVSKIKLSVKINTILKSPELTKI